MNKLIDPNLLPSIEEIKQYRKCGYYISKPIFQPKDLEAAIQSSEAYYASLDSRKIHLPNNRTYDLSWWPEDGLDCLRKNDYSTLVVPELEALLRNPAIGAIAALLCGEDVRLWHDQLLYKPPSEPSDPKSVGWHTDHGYWQTCSSENLLTAWVPFTDMDVSLGTISFIEESLHWPMNDHLDFFSSDLDGLEKKFNTGGANVIKVPAILKQGQVTFHHCRTIHGSGPNTTKEPRRSIALHLQPASNKYKKTYNGDKLASHPNDEMTRRPSGKPDYSDPVYCPVIGEIENVKKAMNRKK